MKCLSIQIQATADARFSVEDVLYLSRKCGRYPEIDSDDDQSGNVNLNYFTEQLPVLWSDLKKHLYEDPNLGPWLKKASLVVCEGDDGWDNYLLLHHYDSNESTDNV